MCFAAPRLRRFACIRPSALRACAAAGLLIALAACGRREAAKPVHAPEAVTLATANQPVGALVYVAWKLGYFREEGLAVTLQPHTSGKDALASVLAGKADFAEVAETPIVVAMLRGEAVSVLATVATTDRGMAVLGRRDLGILQPRDLKGRRVGVTPGTNGDYFLDAFLQVHGFSAADIRTVPLRPDEMESSIVTGRVEAVATWQPHLLRIQDALGDRATAFQGSGIYTWAWNVATRPESAASRPETVRALLRALLRAERHAAQRPDESARIVAEHIGMDPALMGKLWPAYDFNVTLAQWLIVSMEEQARWAIRRDLATAERVPDFLDAAFTDGLRHVRPAAMTVLKGSRL